MMEFVLESEDTPIAMFHTTYSTSKVVIILDAKLL